MSGLARAALVPSWVVLAALAGVTALGLATRWGPGLTPDSVVYVDAARSLAAGDGLVAVASDGERAPLTHFPPLYPAALAGAIALGADALAAARWLGVALLAANAALVGLAVRASTPGARVTPGLAALLAAASAQMLRIHAAALSEPLFLLLASAGLLLLGRHLERPRRARLVAAAACIGLAPLARYAGLALVAAGALALAWRAPGPPRRRLSQAALFAGVALLPLAAWLARNRAATGDAVGRALGVHWIEPAELARGLGTVASWFLLEDLPRPVAAALLALLAGALVGRGTRPLQAGGRRSAAAILRRLGAIPSVFAIFGAAYVVFLLASISFVDAYTPLNHRILAPLFVATLVVVMRCADRAAPARPAWRRAAGLAAALFVVGYTSSAASWTLESRRDGVWPGYGTRAWRESPTLAALRALPPERPLYSNAADAVRALTGRPARSLPRRWDPVSEQWEADFPSELRAFGRAIEHGHGLVVWFEGFGWRRYLVSRDDLASLPLRSLGRYPDGELLESR